MHTRVQFIEQLRKETLTNEITEKLTQLEQSVFSKYNSFEKEIDAIMTHKKDLEETPWKTEEEWVAFDKKFDNITDQFNQLYTIISQNDSPEYPNRIIKEWNEVQNEMDDFLLNISEELNKPLSYSTMPRYSKKYVPDIHTYRELAKKVIVTKGKPVNFTMEDLDKEEENDEDFKCQ